MMKEAEILQSRVEAVKKSNEDSTRTAITIISQKIMTIVTIFLEGIFFFF